jgi:hypothetical protein
LLLALVAAVGAYEASRLATGQSARGASTCSVQTLPAAIDASQAEVARTFAGTRVKSLVGNGTLDAQGVQVIGAVVSDQSPDSSALRTPGRVPDGYEVRWWSPAQDHQAVDEFLFASPGDADEYVSHASSADCRRSATSYALSEPVAARALIWVNPDSTREADLFFASGRIGYRVVEVPPVTYQHGPARFDSAELIDLAQRLACQLPQPVCRRPPAQPMLSPQADSALRLLTTSLPRLRGVPLASQSSALGGVCQRMDPSADAQALTVEESCQAVVNYITELGSARGWQRAGGTDNEAANLKAAAGDLQRIAADQLALAAQLKPGLCRAGFSFVGNIDAQQAEAFQAYAHGLRSQDGPDFTSARARERLIDTEIARESAIAYRVYRACVPTPA